MRTDLLVSDLKDILNSIENGDYDKAIIDLEYTIDELNKYREGE